MKTARVLTFTEACELPGILGRVVPIELAHNGFYSTKTTTYVFWFDYAIQLVNKSGLRFDQREEALDEIERLLDAAE